MKIIIHFQKFGDKGIIEVYQDCIHALHESTGFVEWMPTLTGWCGSFKSNMELIDNPVNISTIFPDYDGQAYFFKKDAVTVGFEGSGPLKHHGNIIGPHN